MARYDGPGVVKLLIGGDEGGKGRVQRGRGGAELINDK
jgi:hypothetical protein